MIPRWKLKREIGRIRDQVVNLPYLIKSIPGRIAEPSRRREWHANLAKFTREIAGERPAGKKLAIFLIFQPGGIPGSVIYTLEWLLKNGYSPFVISNAPVSTADQQVLVPYCWKILERQNFGYDFGGYQDAIRLVNEAGIDPERLIVMNDSVWLPMTDGLLENAEARLSTGADICGLLRDEKVVHDLNGGAPAADRFHIESYFYLMSSEAWRNSTFQAFWRDYRMTEYKPHTIKYGEIGFSRKMHAAGLVLRALTQRSSFMEEIAGRDDAFLTRTLDYAAYADRDLLRASVRLRNISPSDPGWREQALEHIRRCANRKRFNACFPYANDHIFGTFYMKKSREPIFAEQRRQYLRALKAGLVASPPEKILDELTVLVDGAGIPPNRQ